jgi:hypothetical protein
MSTCQLFSIVGAQLIKRQAELSGFDPRDERRCTLVGMFVLALQLTGASC